MILRQGREPDKSTKECPCLRDLALEGVPSDVAPGHYCIVMGAQTSLQDFDLENKCVGLYEACDFYARHRQQESPIVKRRARPRSRWASSIYAAARLFL